MPAQPNGLQETKWADHLRACVDLSKEIADRMGIHADEARQACFATLVIASDRHNLFLEPHPPHSKTPVIQPEPAAVSDGPAKKVESRSDQSETAAVNTAAVGSPSKIDIDEQRAQNADRHASEAIRNPTEAQADGAKRGALLGGISDAVKLLNKQGHVPPVTPGGLNKFIAKEFPGKTELGVLETDELERLIMLLASKLEVLKEKQAKEKAKSTDIDF